MAFSGEIGDGGIKVNAPQIREGVDQPGMISRQFLIIFLNFALNFFSLPDQEITQIQLYLRNSRSFPVVAKLNA